MTAETKRRRCAGAGCEMSPPLGVKYCSDACRDTAKQQRLDEDHVRRFFDQAENAAARTEDCRNCPGGFVYSDEDGNPWCMCGRNATNTPVGKAA